MHHGDSANLRVHYFIFLGFHRVLIYTSNAKSKSYFFFQYTLHLNLKKGKLQTYIINIAIIIYIVIYKEKFVGYNLVYTLAI